MDQENLTMLEDALARFGRQGKIAEIAAKMEHTAEQTGMDINDIVFVFHQASTYVEAWAKDKLSDEYEYRLFQVAKEKVRPFSWITSSMDLG